LAQDFDEMGGFGSGKHGRLPVVERGRKLDLRELRRTGAFVPDGRCHRVDLTWRDTERSKDVASMTIMYCASVERDPRFAVAYTAKLPNGDVMPINDTFQLEAFPQPFGGHRWYFICPYIGKRAQVLYMPSGEYYFGHRLSTDDRMQYRSQCLVPSMRLQEQSKKVAKKILASGPPEWRDEMRGCEFPPKPPWMRWRTYEASLSQWENYQAASKANYPICFR
jgi:hypothetical protein